MENSALTQAGLFSGVVTAFLIQAYQDLKPNPVDTTNELLSRILLRLDNSVVPSAPASVSSFSPSTHALWVNRFLYGSLSCSLSAAFGAMVGKQSLYQYFRRCSAKWSDEDRGRNRHVKFSALERWYFRPVMESFTNLLLLSLQLASVGAILLIWPIDHPLAFYSIGMMSLFYSVFVLMMVTATIFPASPYQTATTVTVRSAVLSARNRFHSWRSKKHVTHSIRAFKDSARTKSVPLGQEQGQQLDALDRDAIVWVLMNTHNMSLVTAAAQFILLYQVDGKQNNTIIRLCRLHRACPSSRERYALERALVHIASKSGNLSQAAKNNLDAFQSTLVDVEDETVLTRGAINSVLHRSHHALLASMESYLSREPSIPSWANNILKDTSDFNFVADPSVGRVIIRVLGSTPLPSLNEMVKYYLPLTCRFFASQHHASHLESEEPPTEKWAYNNDARLLSSDNSKRQ
jgi:hypothetical protein